MYNKYLFKTSIIFVIIFMLIGMSFITSTGRLNEEKKLEILRTSDINGIYYLRDDDPLNYMDEGSLLRQMPLDEEVTLCGLFILFHFAEKDDYLENLSLINIYYHIWQKTPESPLEGEIFDLGYYTSSGHNTYMNESIMINTSNNIVNVDNYRLVQAIQSINPNIAKFDSEGIYNFTLKLVGNGPNIRSFPNQYSFIILNLEDNTTLKSYDRDNDYLNDYEELFIYYTNPFDIDTDDDGVSDYFEYLAGTDPNDFSDFLIINNPPGMVSITGPNGVKPGISYQFKFSAEDPDGDDVKYIIDWGDTQSDSTIYVHSGKEMTLSHTWTTKGTYIIKAKAKDEFGIFGPLTTKTVNVQRTKTVHKNLLDFLQNYNYIFPVLQLFLKILKL
ncbi:hypothetical protein AYK24_05750 [Thermoplasmatales archaeon SG8-52-4]|nr:MAG: hypothetical protein AYK24_05750 [Thermoplasmatales archaeon SG8-52-4]